MLAMLQREMFILIGQKQDAGRHTAKPTAPNRYFQEKIKDDSSFIDDLGADSLDAIELVMAFEDEFGCQIPDAAAQKIMTVNDIVGFIEQNV